MAFAAWCERTNTHLTAKFLLKPRTGLCETDQFWIVATSADPPLFDRPRGGGMRPKACDPLTVAECGICGPERPLSPPDVGCHIGLTMPAGAPSKFDPDACLIGRPIIFNLLWAIFSAIIVTQRGVAQVLGAEKHFIPLGELVAAG